MMNIAQIKATVDAGQPVRWSNDGYHITRDTRDQYLITCQHNHHSIGLTTRNGTRLNGKPTEFYIADGPQVQTPALECLK